MCFISKSSLFFYIQDFHLGQVPEGSVRQFADAVPLQFKHLQTGQTLEGQTLYLMDTVPVQVTVELNKIKNSKKEQRRPENNAAAAFLFYFSLQCILLLF